EELARRMLAVLESQRRLGGAAYPPTLRRLAELCELKGSDSRIPKAASQPTMADRTIVVARKGKTLILDAPIAFKEDVAGELATVLAALLRFALGPVTTMTKGRTIKTDAFSPVDAKKRLISELQDRFAEVVERGLTRQDLPPDVAWILIRGKPFFFLVESA